MIQFSIPTALGIFAASSAVAVTSVAVAVPILQTDPVAQPVATATASPTSTPTTTPVAGTGGDSPLSAWPDHAIGNGVMLHDLPMGMAANVNSTGVTFSYVGPCVNGRASMTVWGNNGQVKSTGGGSSCEVGKITFVAGGINWGEDTRNSYCYSPLGAASAYRAEVYGVFTDWVSIPAEYKQCINGQAPEGPLPPGEIAPVTPPAPVERAPAPSVSDTSSPSPSVSATP